MKACPSCAQMIQDEAIKCRHCGGWLDQDEAKRAEAAVESPKLVAVRIYSYLLLVFAALYALGMIIILLVSRRSGLSGSFGGPELIMLLMILGICGGVVFLALGLMKRKRIAYILNLVVLAMGLITGIIMLVLLIVPNSPLTAMPESPTPAAGRVSAIFPFIILTGAWLAYFISKRRLFMNRPASGKGDK
jgi:hypothetical protein